LEVSDLQLFEERKVKIDLLWIFGYSAFVSGGDFLLFRF
jgi:hypothetical protein